LRRETIVTGANPQPRKKRGRGTAVAPRESRSAETAATAKCNCRRECSHEGPPSTDWAHGSDQWARADLRRIWHGERISSPGRSHAKPTQGRNFCGGELRRHTRGSDRKRTL